MRLATEIRDGDVVTHGMCGAAGVSDLGPWGVHSVAPARAISYQHVTLNQSGSLADVGDEGMWGYLELELSR